MFKRAWNTVVCTARVAFFRFDADLCFLRASSLTFQSLLSIVPVLAVMFGISKGFGFERLLEKILRDEFHDQGEVINHLIDFGYRLLEQAQGGIIAGIGIVVLFFTVMRLFANIEASLNAMWGISQGRSLARKVSDYLALILICPILILVSSSITLFVRTKLQGFIVTGVLSEQITPLLVHLIPLIPYVMSTILFTLIYMIMPYITVRLPSALCAGLFAGCAYQILQATYITIQIQVSNAGAIYGSFAALPLFLMWLYLSWLIFLIGAEISVIHQERLWNSDTFGSWKALSRYETKLVSLACVKIAVDSFSEDSPIHIKKLAEKLHMPVRLIRERAEELTEKKILFNVATDAETLVPTKDPQKYCLFEVAREIDGKNSLSVPLVEQLDQLLTEEKNIPLKEIYEKS